MNLLQKGLVFLDAQRLKLAVDVTYRRDAQEVVVKAVVGKTVFRVDTGQGFLERYESRDFLVPAAVLILGAVPIEPQAGDKIVETDGGKVFTYECMAPGDEPCWRYSGPGRTTLRIHTKLILIEDA